MSKMRIETEEGTVQAEGFDPKIVHKIVVLGESAVALLGLVSIGTADVFVTRVRGAKHWRVVRKDGGSDLLFLDDIKEGLWE